jgi:hypothetical protein
MEYVMNEESRETSGPKPPARTWRKGDIVRWPKEPGTLGTVVKVCDQGDVAVRWEHSDEVLKSHSLGLELVVRAEALREMGWVQSGDPLAHR